MGKKVIEIACRGAGALELEEYTALQGKLKSLDVVDYERLRDLIIDLGFSDPIAIWKQKSKYYMLNGHQRVAVIRRMVEKEGWECPPLPFCLIEAPNLKVAKDKLLALSTQFGRIEGDGLYNFLQGQESSAEELMKKYRFADFSMRDFIDSYLLDPTPVRDGAADGPSSLSPNHPDATPSFPDQMLAESPPSPPVDRVSNTQTYKNETKALENFLGSDVRRITIYMNPNDYDTAVSKMSSITEKMGFKDYRDVLFFLLSNYGQAIAPN